MKVMRWLCVAMVLGLAGTAGADPLHQIVLSWAPAGPSNWSLYADIEADEAIVSWGLDLYFQTPVEVTLPVIYGPSWDPNGVYAQSPDPTDPLVAFNFADISTYPPPDGVWGPAVLLATLTLQNVTNPYAQVTVWAHDQYHVVGAQVVDLNEGFGKNPPPSALFVDWVMIPEPTTIVLLGLGLLGLARRR